MEASLRKAESRSAEAAKQVSRNILLNSYYVSTIKKAENDLEGIIRFASYLLDMVFHFFLHLYI